VRIVLILPSFVSGGLEKVITELAWYFSRQKDIQVFVISLMKGEVFFPLPNNIKLYSPAFEMIGLTKPIYLMRLMFWLRGKAKKIAPNVVLSFGGKYNSFVLLSLYGLSFRVYISERSRPSISYGRFLDFLNPRVYKKATGIIAQTEKAKEVMVERTGHSNIKVIGNPLRMKNGVNGDKEKIILNVGRFVSTKKQGLLVQYFAQINQEGWKVYFVGDGPTMPEVKNLVAQLGMEDKIHFCNEVNNVADYYNSCSIFAFTSVSEGFPNVLGEAMLAGQACISFDCEAGPADLIEDGVNGFLIQEEDHEAYIEKLRLLMNDLSLRQRFGKNAKESMRKFDFDQIGKQFLDFFKQDVS
jgi:GalNAc-alpha-(1->4)-GalNAc-alpha-(1->3)-diNAcBac-PP-undecaprenol alpha-1,4-N-acetyl-D-galactosaminyltransferase